MRAVRAYRLSIGLLLIVCLVGCATFQRASTPKQRYFTALKQFNDTVEDYMIYYKAADVDVQEDWRRTIHPAIRQVSAVLDAWGVLVDEGQPSAQKEQQFIKMRRQLFNLLVERGILEVEK